MNTEERCTECNGETIQFRFSGKDTQFRICTRYKEPGHLSETEIKARRKEVMDTAWPPGAYGLRRQA